MRVKLGQSWFWLALLTLANVGVAAPDPCGICGKEIRDFYNVWEDKVAHVQKRLCKQCTQLPDRCYLCSLPLLKNYRTLLDGRTICERDARTVVLDDGEAARLCEKVKADLDRQFARFITFPDTNVTLELMDRVNLQEIYQVIGNDYTCPNTLGCTWPETNAHGFKFRISLLSGLPRQELQTTCVHEHAHTWLIENLSPARVRYIGKDAIEGFCELVSYLFAEAQNLGAARTNILMNHYTRGQIYLFIEAERRFGFNEIVEWMKYGEDQLLLTNELGRVRLLATPVVTNAPAKPVYFAPARAFDELTLQGITWSRTRPTAMINGRTFEPSEEAKVRLGDTNITIRCVSISEDSVVVQAVGTNESQTLKLR